jgi:hypothetical protein
MCHMRRRIQERESARDLQIAQGFIAGVCCVLQHLVAQGLVPQGLVQHGFMVLFSTFENTCAAELCKLGLSWVTASGWHSGVSWRVDCVLQYLAAHGLRQKG